MIKPTEKEPKRGLFLVIEGQHIIRDMKPNGEPELQDFRDAIALTVQERCLKGCIIAKAAIIQMAANSMVAGETLEAASQKSAAKFGRCASGPIVRGRCQTASTCTHEDVENLEDPQSQIVELGKII